MITSTQTTIIDYARTNAIYWRFCHLSGCSWNCLHTGYCIHFFRSLLQITPKQMTDTVNVLPHLRELRAAWRQQDFQFTKEQQEEYDILTIARQERVKYFYQNGLVHKNVVKQSVE